MYQEFVTVTAPGQVIGYPHQEQHHASYGKKQEFIGRQVFHRIPGIEAHSQDEAQGHQDYRKE